MAKTIKMPVVAGSPGEERLKNYLFDRLEGMIEGLRDIHETRYLAWRKIYEATPLESVREFPFHNASNLVIPIAAIHSDTLLARILAAVFKTKPTWTARVIGKSFGAKKEDAKAELEKFGSYVALEPGELDLWRVYHEFFGETIKYGTSTIKCPQQDVVDYVAGDGVDGITYTKRIVYSGPRPEKIPFVDFLIPPSAKTCEAADFKAHRVRLQKQDLEERAFRKLYDKAAVDEIIKTGPDLTSPDSIASNEQNDVGAREIPGYGWAEWHVYECHFRYRVDSGQYVKCIVWFHKKTKTILRAYFNYYPDDIFISGRLFYRDNNYFGYGFCEILAMLQEEISQIHNGRRDNSTIANTKLWRANTDSKLHKGYKIYPGALIPADKDEIEPLEHGAVAEISVEEERLALDLSERRTGVQPPMQGMGAGTNNKRGIYTAQGTMSMLMEGNTRTDLNITDMRYAHTKLGRLVFNQYAEFGIGKRKQMFESILSEALNAVQSKKIVIPILSATASVNKEVEKQNNMLLLNVVNSHYQAVTNMMVAAGNQQLPVGVREYVQAAIRGAVKLTRIVMRAFEHDDEDILVPEPERQPVSSSSSSPGQQPAPGQPSGQPQAPGPASAPASAMPTSATAPPGIVQ